MAGVTIVPNLHTTQGSTLASIKTALEVMCPDFPANCTLVYVQGPEQAQGHGKLVEVTDDSTTADELRAMGDALYVICMTPHKMKVTAIHNEYERGDIDCANCKTKGPSRRTGHQSCEGCKFCGVCCVRYTRCHAEPTPHEDTAAVKAALEVYLQEFYTWQRGIMKPY